MSCSPQTPATSIDAAWSAQRGCPLPAPYEPVPFRLERLTAEERVRRSHAFLETMSTRRSCRFFSQERVAPELIQNAIRAAATAPSGANQQPWTFVVVEDPSTKAAIRDAAEREERVFYERGPAAWREALAPLGTDAVKTHITDAPYVIVVFARTHELAICPLTRETTTTKNYYVRESVGIACGLLLASLTHAGLATLPHTPSPMAFLAKLLGRPENERAELLVPVGLPADDATVPRHALSRKPLGDILVWR